MKLSEKRGSKNQTGALGEQITCDWLKNKGFSVIATNYGKSWGEIDVIAQKGKMVHFVEVKTVSYETKSDLVTAVTRESWRPEEQVHQFKLRKLGRIIETWLLEQKYEGEWQIDVAAVRIVPHEKFAQIKYLENIVAD